MGSLGERLQSIVGTQAVLDRPDDLMMYEYDGGLQKSRPEAVVFPSTTDEVAAIVKLAAAEKVPLLARPAHPLICPAAHNDIK